MSLALSQKDYPYKHWEYKDVNTGNRLRIVPERGGLITEWLCNGKNILYFDLDRFQLSDKSIRGGIPILFPICGDFQGGSCVLNEETVIVVNNTKPMEHRLKVLAESFLEFNLDDVYMVPALRAYIDDSRSLNL